MSISHYLYMNADIEKTRRYYDGLTQDDCCDCAYCRNFYAQAKAAYPALADYLAALGVDILKPLRLSYGLRDDGLINYFDCMYTVFGSCPDDFRHEIGEIVIKKEDRHPATYVTGEHFVLDAGCVYLNMILPTGE